MRKRCLCLRSACALRVCVPPVTGTGSAKPRRPPTARPFQLLIAFHRSGVDHPGMPGMYRLKDLLKIVVEQRAAELRLEPDRPPMMLLHGKVRVLDGPVVSSDHISELFRGVATEEQ